MSARDVSDRGVACGDLSRLLQDRTFVDYFNIFLSLPIFQQKLFYKFDDKDFDVDPPLRRTHQALDRGRLISWINEARLCYFEESELYLDYLLCVQLQQTPLHLTDSSHDIEYLTDDIRQLQDQDFLFRHIGHVLGMCRFKEYLSGSAGEKVFDFWKDAERFHQIPSRQQLLKKCLLREMQVKYFCRGGFTNLEDDSAWEALKDISTILKEEVETCSEDIINDEEDMSLRNLQRLVLVVLRAYWLQKYLTHCRLQEGKAPQADGGEVVKIGSLSDLVLLEQVRGIDRVIRLAQGNLNVDPRTRTNKSQIMWRSLFHGDVDDSFLNNTEEIVTMHSPGHVTVHPLGSDKLEKELEMYLRSPVPSLSSASSSQSQLSDEITRIQGRTSASSQTSTSSDISIERLVPSRHQGRGTSGSRTSVSSRLRCASKTSQVSTGADSRSASNLSRRSSHRRRSSARMTIHVSCDGYKEIITGRPLKTHIRPIELEQHQSQSPKLSTVRRPFTSPAVTTSKARKVTNLPKLKVKGKGKRKINTNILTLVPAKSTLPPIVEQDVMRSPDAIKKMILPEFSTNCRGIIVRPVSYQYQNTSEGNFRFDNHRFMMAMAAETCGGRPIEHFLSNRHSVPEMIILHFWQTCQYYISLCHSPSATDYNKLRQARLLVVRHLLACSEESVCDLGLTQQTCDKLQKLLMQGEGEDLLMTLQDQAARKVQHVWEMFAKLDMHSFLSTAVVAKVERRQGKFARRNAAYTLAESIGLGSFDEKESHDFVSLSYRRATRAIQLTMKLTNLDDQSLLVDPIQPLDSLRYESESQEGSLAIKKLETIKRKDLEEEMERRRMVAMAAREERLAELRAMHEAQREPEPYIDDDLPLFAHPFRKDGRWVVRPSKPRSFNELLRSPVQLEFFRRFMAHFQTDTPLNFWCAVEELKNTKDAKQRQSNINQILRRFFLNNRRFAELDCQAEVVSEIPKMEKVNPAMLVSAQSCISRAMESKWFQLYSNTFPESDREAHKEGAASITMRKFSKSRTKYMWRTFVRLVLMFRMGILNPKLCAAFKLFLKSELHKEIEKQKANGTQLAAGVPVRKVIKHRLVDMTKLINDLEFLAEGERFRTLCDSANQAAEAGIYRTGDQQLLEIKAKTIINCFIDSEMPPRIQVNISQDLAEAIVEIYSNGMVDRGLFHDAAMCIFPCMAYLWKRFQKHRIAHIWFLTAQPEVVIPMIDRPPTPDYINMTPHDAKTVITNHRGDEGSRVTFSLSQGMRIVMPVRRMSHDSSSSHDSLHQANPHSASSGHSLYDEHGNRITQPSASHASIADKKKEEIKDDTINESMLMNATRRRRSSVYERRTSLAGSMAGRRMSLNPGMGSSLLLARKESLKERRESLKEQGLGGLRSRLGSIDTTSAMAKGTLQESADECVELPAVTTGHTGKEA